MTRAPDPYDLPFPAARPLATTPSRVRDRRRPAPRLAARRPAVAGRAPGNRTHPRTPNPTWKPNHDPDPEATAMTLTINDTTMTSDQTPHTARHAPGRNGWEVSWLPGQTLDRNTAITAMILADTAAECRPARGAPALAAHPGLGSRTRPDRHPTRSAAASQPPRDPDPQQEHASGQPTGRQPTDQPANPAASPAGRRRATRPTAAAANGSAAALPGRLPAARGRAATGPARL